MAKTICDWSKKDLEERSKKLFSITSDPTHHCRKCGRVANKKKYLCKPRAFQERGIPVSHKV